LSQSDSDYSLLNASHMYNYIITQCTTDRELFYYAVTNPEVYLEIKEGRK